MFRGNTVMSGYLKDPKATEDAFVGGWFRSGGIGIKHPDGYIEVKDRLKDIVISGDDHWGQTPCAFVKLKDGFHVNAQEIIQHCRDHMPHFMSPRTVISQDLPRNSTGKVEKFVLREKEKSLGSLSH
ncbi:hypothetical protein CTI12_AA230290 [Artemisia annua]|uniref:AMP-binding enzyme C-terminal domain-containing protein n=1 Tax=Artemisia annua TaxID=35608 RepID=A0A2U1NTX9_ARTAN|nr:hypothetical protein CTI12_AA230290 [Artemisia annua]